MTVFTDKAPRIMKLLIQDFNLTEEEAAAILGNLGHESGGFRFLQEKKPLIPGSRGGYGWAQWTGPRRVAYEAYCARNGLDPSSDKANYGFLFVELNGSEKEAIPAVKSAIGLEAKVKAFENKFERAGIKHYDSRYNYARQALKAYRDNKEKQGESTAIVIAGGGIAAAAASPPEYWPLVFVSAIVLAVAGYYIVRWYKRRKLNNVANV